MQHWHVCLECQSKDHRVQNYPTNADTLNQKGGRQQSFPPYMPPKTHLSWPHLSMHLHLASFPGLHAQLLSLAVQKAGEAWTDLSRDVCHGWHHVQSAHVWVCSLHFTLLSLNSVCSFCSICPASPIATGSIVAMYSTWRQPRHASRDKSVQAFPRFSYCKRQKLGVEAWERGYLHFHMASNRWMLASHTDSLHNSIHQLVPGRTCTHIQPT